MVVSSSAKSITLIFHNYKTAKFKGKDITEIEVWTFQPISVFSLWYLPLIQPEQVYDRDIHVRPKFSDFTPVKSTKSQAPKTTVTIS